MTDKFTEPPRDADRVLADDIREAVGRLNALLSEATIGRNLKAEVSVEWMEQQIVGHSSRKLHTVNASIFQGL